MPRNLEARRASAANAERRRHVRGLLLLALVALAFAIFRFGIHRTFPQGWWRLW